MFDNKVFSFLAELSHGRRWLTEVQPDLLTHRGAVWIHAGIRLAPQHADLSGWLLLRGSTDAMSRTHP